MHIITKHAYGSKTVQPPNIIVTHMVIQGCVMCFCSSISMQWWNYNAGNQGNCPRKYMSSKHNDSLHTHVHGVWLCKGYIKALAVPGI